MSRVDHTQRTSRQASAQGVESARPVEVLDPSDSRGRNIRYADPDAGHNDNRRTAQNFSRATNTKHQTQTNASQDPNEPSGKNAHENIIGQARTFVDKIGTALMWGAGGFAGFLYLGLGWKGFATFIAAVGVGGGYLLKTKLAKVGEEPDHDRQIVDAIKAKKLPKELEVEILKFLEQRLAADAYQNSIGQDLSGKARDILGNFGKQAVNAAQQAASTVADRFNNQPSTQPT